ncbi:hypothetical protein [Methylobacterium sp. Gmos1]
MTDKSAYFGEGRKELFIQEISKPQDRNPFFKKLTTKFESLTLFNKLRVGALLFVLGLFVTATPYILIFEPFAKNTINPLAKAMGIKTYGRSLYQEITHPPLFDRARAITPAAYLKKLKNIDRDTVGSFVVGEGKIYLAGPNYIQVNTGDGAILRLYMKKDFEWSALIGTRVEFGAHVTDRTPFELTHGIVYKFTKSIEDRDREYAEELRAAKQAAEAERRAAKERVEAKRIEIMGPFLEGLWQSQAGGADMFGNCIQRSAFRIVNKDEMKLAWRKEDGDMYSTVKQSKFYKQADGSFIEISGHLTSRWVYKGEKMVVQLSTELNNTATQSQAEFFYRTGVGNGFPRAFFKCDRFN